MRASVITALSAAAAVSADLGPAAAITDNPIGASAVATFPAGALVQGKLTAKSGAGGAGVDFSVDITEFPSYGGPFLYHIHAFPVPADGNCTGTEAHLDPQERGEDPPCDPTQPATCQVGDLSGKHGKITGNPPFVQSYNDAYASLKPGIGAYFGNRSVVVHFANKTRITCANWTVTSTGGLNSTGGATPSGTGAGPAPTQTGYMNSANKIAGSSAAVLLAVAAAFL